jgi:choline monooxygenase
VIPRYLLPPAAYHSAAWFEQEQTTLFAARWTLCAAIEELDTPGAYVTTTVGRAPIVVVRGDDGDVRAFHNLCRHRGMALLGGAGRLERCVTCFYHGWRYTLAGELTVVPQRREQFPDLVPSEWPLLPAALEVWEGMVFVHPDPAAEPLATSLSGVAEFLGSHQPGRLTQVAHARIEARCNWKLLVENHVDVYHLWYLHEASLGEFDHTRFEHVQTGGNWTSYEPIRDDHPTKAALTRNTATIAHLDERDRLGLGAHLVFPNLMVATAAGFFATYTAEPVAPDRTIIDLRVRAEPGADAASLLEAVQSFIREDVLACEAVQSSVSSPAFTVGPLARDHEQPIAAFQGHVLAALGCEP